MKITAETVKGVMSSALPNRTKYYFDEDLTGFGFYRTTTGTGTFFAEFRPVSGGNKKRLRLGRVGTLKVNEAREAARKAIANATLGKDLAKDRADERTAPTVAKLVTDFIAGKELKPATREFYKSTLRKHVEPRIGSIKSTALTRADVQRLHSAISGKYAANRAVAMLSSTYGWASKHGLVPEGLNPARGVDRNREQARERFLSADEMKKLGDAMIEAETIGFPVNAGTAKHAPKGQRIKMHPSVTGALRLLMLTGCRLREILHLRWADVDLERGFLFLPDTKTGRKTVVLSSAAQDILKSLPRVGEYVVASESAGTPDEKPRADLKRPWKAITARAGLDGLRIHDLRHSFASVGAWSRLGLPIIGALLGHADSKTTQRYAHVDADASRRAADAIAGQIAAAIGGK